MRDFKKGMDGDEEAKAAREREEKLRADPPVTGQVPPTHNDPPSRATALRDPGGAMIEISFGKLLLLAVVALIVLGPEKLPHAARTAGLLIRRMRNGWDNVKAEVEREIQAEEIKRTLRETAESARSAHDSVRDEIRGAGQDIRGNRRSCPRHLYRDTDGAYRGP